MGRASWRPLRALLRPYRWWLLLAFVTVVVAAGVGLAVPWLSGAVIDTAAGATTTGPPLDVLVLVLLLLFAVQAVATALRSWALARAGQGAVRDLRRRLFDRILGLPTGYFDRVPSGEVGSRLLSDAGAVYGSGAGSGPQAAYAALTVLGGTALLVAISPSLGLLILLVVPVAVALSLLSGRSARRLSREYQDALAGANAWATEAVSGIRVVRGFRAEGWVAERYGRLSDRAVALGIRRARVRAVWQAVVAFLASWGVVAAVWLGGRQIQAGALSAGDLLAVVWYGLVVTRGIADLSGLYGRWQQALGSADRVLDLLETAPEHRVDGAATAAVDLVGPSGSDPAVDLRDVTFTYPNRSQPALCSFSLRVAPGETVALVGPSGAGKSSVVRLLLGLYEPDSGRVRVHGHDPRSGPLAAVVPQDPHLLSGSVRENLLLARPDANDDELWRALRAAHAADLVAGLPLGLDTTIGERGVTLSGGQQQRLALARALVVDAPVLVLDEATSALDSRSEADVRAAVGAVRAGRTSIVIAHRLATVRDCDRVVVMADGRVIEEGTARELQRRAGLFAELAALQR